MVPSRRDSITRRLKDLGVVQHNQAEKANLISQTGLYLCRQLPTLPHTFACSTIGPAGLNFRVRDGNGWNPRGKITDKSRRLAGVSEAGAAAEIPSAVCEGSLRHLAVAFATIFSATGYALSG